MRGKNKLTLNPNGEVAVRRAQRVLEEARHMVDQVRADGLCCQRMPPSTYFLLQNNFEDFDELAASSVLPTFSSNVMMRNHPREEHRIQIPHLHPRHPATAESGGGAIGNFMPQAK